MRLAVKNNFTVILTPNVSVQALIQDLVKFVSVEIVLNQINAGHLCEIPLSFEGVALPKNGI